MINRTLDLDMMVGNIAYGPCIVLFSFYSFRKENTDFVLVTSNLVACHVNLD